MTSIIVLTLAGFGCLFLVLCIAFAVLIRRGSKARKGGKGRAVRGGGPMAMPRHSDPAPAPIPPDVVSGG